LESRFRECGSVGIVFGSEVPGVVDPVDRVLGDAGQNLAEIIFGIESIEFRSNTTNACRAKMGEAPRESAPFVFTAKPMSL
jgi:hypothetical protein